MTLRTRYSVTEFFDEFSATYTRNAVWARSKVLNNAVVEIVNSKHPATIVDLGTGDGELLSLFPQIRNRIGIDISSHMLALIHDAGIWRILGDIHSVALQSSSVDFVVCRQVLHYCQTNLVFQEVSRILRSDGYVLVIQMTDSDSVPKEWYAKWKSFKRIRGRKHLTRLAIIREAKKVNFELELEKRCEVDVELSWNELYQKYAAFTKRQKIVISTFFQHTPESIAKTMRLHTDKNRITYQRAFVCLIFRNKQCLDKI